MITTIGDKFIPPDGTTGCTTQYGDVLTKGMPFTPPTGTVYLSNKGVRVGDTVEAVFAAHGAPLGVLSNAGRVFEVYYCGLTFYFAIPGHVSSIRVNEQSNCANP